MKFIYEAQDFSTLERGEERSWLLTNGLGGYMSTTAAFSVNRCDEGLLVAAEVPPNLRVTLVHRLSERLHTGTKTCFLSTQSFADGHLEEDGYRHIRSFTWDGVPVWSYQVEEITIQRHCGMAHGENTASVVYQIHNGKNLPCTLQVVPSFLFTRKGDVLKEPPSLCLNGLSVMCGTRQVNLRTNGAVAPIPLSVQRLNYSADAQDGRPSSGFSGQCCVISFTVQPNRTGLLELTCSTESSVRPGTEILQECARRQKQILQKSKFSHPVARQLAQSADAFLVRRKSTEGMSIIAGYPLFGDWGRDTMIALPGCTLSVGRYQEAKRILQTFLAYEQDGLVPNLFPEGENQPLYNTVDAALLLIHSIWLYYQKTGDENFIREAWPVMERIVNAYSKGTKFEISMDEDGLIRAGKGLDQVTWMDVRIDNILPTPRHGKPVEVNAYWYNALCMLRELAPLVGLKGESYAALAEKVRTSFQETFWMEERHCLRDVLSGTKADEQIRCNQIWAVSLPFSILPPEHEKAVVETVFQTLYTSHGLRTLSPEDPDFHPFYGGSQYERDMAYHQGTVWPFPMGAFYLAWLKVHGNTPEAAAQVEQMLEPMEAMLREGCVGQLPEIYDGGVPSTSKGCFAQAWSVGEILRVYERIEEIKTDERRKIPMLDKNKPGWWKSAVFYQIYPKSFQDTDGDGIGDLNGVISRLDYLQTLGVDGIWLSPVFASPQADNGYDVSDYCAIDPMFGTMADMERLIAEARVRGISIILDLVLNHTSEEHLWFQEAKKSRENPYHNYYVWRDGRPDCPPNDMKACFGGSAWTWVPDLEQYYFHQFTAQQPDLNWENPDVRRELYNMILFWMEKGVEGFRLDTIDQIAKEPDQKIGGNGPHLHAFLRELSRETFQKGNIVTVGEAWGADVERAKRYSNPDGSELSMVFQFEAMMLDQGKTKWDLQPLSLPALKQCFARWQNGLYQKGWNSLFLDNHDLPRIVSRWGNEGKYRVESAKMLATMLHGMQGTPYIYQGEELGMTNVRLPIEAYNDIEIKNAYLELTAQGRSHEEAMASIYAMGRDNARTPMQWNSTPNAGFTSGVPWLPVNENYLSINADAALADSNSVFYHYQALIALRKNYPVFRDGTFTLLAPEDEQIFLYRRDTERNHLLVVCNFTAQTLPLSYPSEFAEANMLLSNYPDRANALRPYEAFLLHLEDTP